MSHSAGAGIIVPLVLWGKKCPSHTITAATLSLDQKSLLTGSSEGQICLWDLNSAGRVCGNHTCGLYLILAYLLYNHWLYLTTASHGLVYTLVSQCPRYTYHCIHLYSIVSIYVFVDGSTDDVLWPSRTHSLYFSSRVWQICLFRWIRVSIYYYVLIVSGRSDNLCAHNGLTELNVHYVFHINYTCFSQVTSWTHFA